MDFQHQTVMLTGSAGHLGRAVASAFAALGANLLLVDRLADRLALVHGGATERQLLVAADLLDQSQADHVVTAGIDRFGRIDVLCNLAGGFGMGEAVHETSDLTWNTMFDVNVRTLLHAVRAVVPRMIDGGGGKIVNVGAFSAQKGLAQMGAYCAAKASVIRLTEAMAGELRDKKINVNCVLPSIIDTPDNRSAMPDADSGRWVAPEDLASVIVFLSSQGARAIHGASVPVTGLS